MTSKDIYGSTKVCSKCKVEKSPTEFYKDKRTKDGLQYNCKTCLKSYFEEKREHHLARHKIYRDTNKELHRERYKEQKILTSKIWHENNKEKHAILMKDWHTKNPTIKNAINAKRRANKIQATPSWCETEEIKELYRQCKLITEQTGIKHHVDHIVPLQSNLVCGLHCLANLQIIPAIENISKNNRHWPNMP